MSHSYFKRNSNSNGTNCSYLTLVVPVGLCSENRNGLTNIELGTINAFLFVVPYLGTFKRNSNSNGTNCSYLTLVVPVGFMFRKSERFYKYRINAFLFVVPYLGTKCSAQRIFKQIIAFEAERFAQLVPFCSSLLLFPFMVPFCCSLLLFPFIVPFLSKQL